jgi:hypothetical protein
MREPDRELVSRDLAAPFLCERGRQPARFLHDGLVRHGAGRASGDHPAYRLGDPRKRTQDVLRIRRNQYTKVITVRDHEMLAIRITRDQLLVA